MDTKIKIVVSGHCNFTRLGTVTEWALCLTSVIICQLAICETNKGCK
jgi:hypothetical protein